MFLSIHPQYDGMSVINDLGDCTTSCQEGKYVIILLGSTIANQKLLKGGDKNLHRFQTMSRLLFLLLLT